MRDHRGNEKRQDALIARALARASAGGGFGNLFWQQPVIYLDPLNRTGLASNNNEGLLPTQPIRNWSEALRRYGTESPILPQNVALDFMSSSPPGGTDPIVFLPTMSNFSNLRINGTLDAHNLFGSGTLGAVTAKNRATGQPLQADLSDVPGAAVGMVLVNTTLGKESRSFVQLAISPGVFQLTQPLTISDNWPHSGDPAPVNTYAIGDTFSLYNEDLIDLVQLEVNQADWNYPDPTNNFTVVTSIGLQSGAPGSPLSQPAYFGDAIACFYGHFNRKILVERPFVIQATQFYGCLGSFGIRASIADVQHNSNVITINGGGWANLDVTGGNFNQDVILSGPLTRIIGGDIGAACIDAGAAIQLAQEVALTDIDVGAALWGKGSLNVTFGRLLLEGTTATASLLLTGGIAINGQSTAFTATRANPSVIDGNVAISPANIDAAASGMFVPGGGSIANFG